MKQIAFFTAEWCGLCPKMKEVAEKLAKKKDYKLFEIAVDGQPKLARDMNVKHIPQIIVGEHDIEQKFDGKDEEMFDADGILHRYIGLWKLSDIKL
jgi:thiol-disulfide isomerase/thioredoxin